MLDQHPELWDGWMPKYGASMMHGVKPRLAGELPLWEAMYNDDYREALFLRWVIKQNECLDCAPEIGSIAQWARDTVSTIAALTGAMEIGKISIIRLRAGGRILPHVDGMGSRVCDICQAARASQCMYFKRYPNRLHLAIASNPECLFEAGGETVCMAPGELWVFNQRVQHGVTNAGSTDRIHLLFDARVVLPQRRFADAA